MSPSSSSPLFVLTAALYVGATPAREVIAQSSPGAPLEVAGQSRTSIGLLSGVRTAFLLADGRVVAADTEENVIRIFSATGALVEQLGGRGTDPGQFLRLSWALPRGDVIEAFDGQQRRVTRFSPGAGVEVVHLDAPGYYPSLVWGDALDGWLSAHALPIAVQAGRDVILLERFAPDGSSLGAIDRAVGIDRMILDMSEGRVGGPHPLTPRFVVRISQGRIYVGETLEAGIRVLDASGTLEREIAWGAEPVDAAEALELVRAAAASRPLDELRQRLLSEAQVPSRLSVFWDFLVDEAGFVWVRPYDPLLHAAALGGLGPGSYGASAMGQGGVWRVFSPQGAEVGQVTVPAGLRPVQITSDALVGVRVDPDGVQSIHVHGLERR